MNSFGAMMNDEPDILWQPETEKLENESCKIVCKCSLTATTSTSSTKASFDCSSWAFVCNHLQHLQVLTQVSHHFRKDSSMLKHSSKKYDAIGTPNLRQPHLEQTDNWVKPWAIRASSGHTRSRSTVMELDPSKFTLSASMSLLNEMKGAYHATEIENLYTIMTDGLKPGSDLIEQGRSSGRLRSYFAVFPPWDHRNRLTRTRSRTNQRTPLVTLYIKIVDLIREGGRVTENGAVMCDRPIPFHMVKEMWLCILGNNQSGGFQEIEKILDYTLEDEICTEIADPMTPAAYEMRDHRRLERILELLCDLPRGPHENMKAEIISHLSEYFGVDWSQTDWNVYDALLRSGRIPHHSHAASHGSKDKQRSEPPIQNMPMVLEQYTIVFVKMRFMLFSPHCSWTPSTCRSPC